MGSIGILFVDLNFKQPNTNLLRDLRSLLKNVQLVVFFVVALFSGKNWFNKKIIQNN